MQRLSLFSFASLLTLSDLARARPVNDTLLEEYDYIIVGGGPSGLTVANRLTEDPSVTVLLLEAGPVDQDEEWMRVPFFVGNDPDPPVTALSGHLDYDWNLGTEPQTYLDGKSRHYPLGRGLGGGTLVNGMLWNRGNIDDYNDWATLGNEGWSWDDMLPYFQKSERFSDDVTPDSAAQYGIGRTDDVHGTSGAVNISFQKYFYTASANFYSGLDELGIPNAGDTNAGLTAGASFLPLSIDSTTKTRADARRSHYDPVASRDNFYISNGQYVTRLNLEGVTQPEEESIVDASSVGLGSQPGLKLNTILNAFLDNINIFNIFPGDGLEDLFGLLDPRSVSPQQPADTPPRLRKEKRAPSSSLPSIRIAGVEYATAASAPRQNITARRAVVLAAGAVHTPLLLQLSGIGDASFLSTHNITAAIDLPGVGNNYQDHFMLAANAPFKNSSYEGPKGYGANAADDENNRAAFWGDEHEGPWTAGPPNGVAFPSLKSMSPDNATRIAGDAAQSEYLVDGVDESVVAGWEAQRKLLVAALGNENRSQFEILNDNAGHFTYSVMKPFSRGQVRIRSRDPFDVPVIDPRYGANPADLSFLTEALRFNHRLMATGSMQELQPDEQYPTPDVIADDAKLLDLVKQAIFTEYHPSGTASMLPLDLGGVVNSHLKVYGTQNLVIVDSSIMPMIPAAHLQACVYAVAEKAADLIKEDYKNMKESN